MLSVSQALRYLSRVRAAGGGEDAPVDVGHGSIEFGPTLGLGLGANPAPFPVRSKERAAIADDLAVFVLTRCYRPLSVAALLFLRHLTYSSRSTNSLGSTPSTLASLRMV
jgi:hypothetical protein